MADGHLFGHFFAFRMTVCIAIVMLIIRQHHEASSYLLMPISPAPSRWG